MSEDGTQLIFSELLERHGRIRVPLIQRDYAQGRRDQEEVRDEFLAALHDALLLTPGSEELPLNLDFIYGSVEGENLTSFQPLDGQQRLTTLFLLHWYLAWHDECSEAFSDLCAAGGISRFSYQVRPSSKEFFDELVRFHAEQAPDEVKLVGSLLQDQSWYFRSWRLDPTIQSALVMLDAIHLRFKDTHGLYARIIDTEQPAITFQLLDLKNFGLSDDLYIKMNARGKPLTPFETFKARYEQILQDQFSGETRLIDGQPVPISEYFARRMDTRWADFFWPYRDPESHVFDAAVMNVFRAVILITRSTKSLKFTKDITDLRSRSQMNSYHFFQQRDWLDVPFAETLITLLDAWGSGLDGFVPLLPDRRCFDEEIVLHKILTEPTSLGYDDLIQFAAYVQYLKAHEDGLDPTAFQEWMRVVFNLSVNTEYNRVSDFQRSMSSIADLAPNMTTILAYLADTEADISAFYRPQVAEEKLKAGLLLSDDSWRQLIDEAEVHGYFRGQIGFLLRFAGINADVVESLAQGVDESGAQQLQTAFSDYLSKAVKMFGNRGLHSLPNYRWERALLAQGDYMLEARLNYSFLVDSQAEQISWKRLLRGAASGTDEGEVLKKLWDKLSGTEDLNDQLDQVIASASGLEAWRTALIETPAAIGYCEKRRIRHASDSSIYLLRKIQLNGAHAELFTYCFYINVLSPANKEKKFHVLRPTYYESNTTEIEPGVRLFCNFEEQSYIFDLEFQSGGYRLWIQFEEAIPDVLSSLLLGLGFSKTENRFHRTCPADSIERCVFELDHQLANANEALERE